MMKAELAFSQLVVGPPFLFSFLFPLSIFFSFSFFFSLFSVFCFLFLSPFYLFVSSFSFNTSDVTTVPALFVGNSWIPELYP